MLKNLKEKIIKKRHLHQNIVYLLKTHQLDAKSLSMETGIPTTTISRLKREDSNPTVDSVEPIAHFFRVDVNDLLYTDMSNSQYKANEKSTEIQHIPIVKIEDATKVDLIAKIANRLVINNVSENAFGIQIETESLAPVLRYQSIAVIEPNLEPRDMDYIVCILGDDKIPVFRQIFIDGSNNYFKPINPDYGTMTTHKKFKILGVVIKIIESYR